MPLAHFQAIKTPSIRAEYFNAHRTQILDAAGDNTVPAGLQQQVILQDITGAFSRILAPLGVFASVFRDVPLRGTAVVDVSYYDLQTAASTNFVAGNGYVAGETVTATKAITIDKRKYQAISATSSELARQPFLKVLELTRINAEKLALDVFTDIMSLITLANYGAAAVTKGPELFDIDDVVTVRGACNTANWPNQGRSLLLNSDYDAALSKDAGIKNSAAFNGNVAQTGQIPQVMGFGYRCCPNIPANAENLVGFAVHPAAALIAFSPIQPAPMVGRVSTYEVYTDPATGISFEHRAFGDPQMDKDYDIIECNYGYALGNPAALKRIVSA